MYLGKRSIVVILSYFLATIAIMGGIIAKRDGVITQNESMFTSSYQRNFADLADSLTNIDYALQKGMYANSPYQAISLAATVWKDTGTAKTNLEQLPIYDLNLEKTSKFFSQTGDYVFSLAKNIINGHEITDEERQTLQQLSQQAKLLANSMIQLQQEVISNNSNYNQIKTMLIRQDISNIQNKNNNNTNKNTNTNNQNAIATDAKPETPGQSQGDNPDANNTNQNNTNNGNQGVNTAENSQNEVKNPFQKIELGLEGMPKLIYDGSFSDHINSREPVFIKNKNVVTAEEARTKAAYILDVKTSSLTENSDVNTKQVKNYIFSGNNMDIVITKQGGYAYQFTKNRAIGDVKLSDKEAIAYGKKFLDKINYKGMVESYYWSSGNILTINFAYEQDGVIIYPDLIKVGVALDNGEIVTLDAGEYIMSHKTNRKLNNGLSEDDARKKLSSVLTVQNHRMAVIPSMGLYEKYCHEFKTKSKDGTTVVVYVNAETGVEEDIVILYENENGTLAM
jgi:hypothetical protein